MFSNYLSLISDIFDAKFKKFYLPLIGLFMSLLSINSIYYIHFFIYSYNEWLVADWLINYSGGLVRRGLSGELIFFLSNFLNISVLDFLFLFLSLLQVIFFICIFILLIKKDINFWFFLIFASPSFLSFYLYDPSIISRKEILIYLTYFGWLLMLTNDSKVKLETSIFFSILAIFITMLHEIFLFYSILFYLVTIILFNQKPFSINSSLLIPSSSFITLMMLMMVPTSFNNIAICNKIIEYGVDPSVCIGGILSWPAGGVLEGFYHNFSIYTYWTPFGLVLLLVLPIIPYFIFSHTNNILLKRSNYQKIFFISSQFIFISPLFLVATDWGRWVNIQSILLGLTMLFLLQKKSAMNKTYKNFTFNEKLLGYGLPFTLLVFMSSWNLKHCCRDGNFLFEFNGLFGSLVSIIL